MGRGRSIRGLLARLVDEVALCGKAGALPNDIIGQVKTIYLELSNDDAVSRSNGTDGLAIYEKIPPTIDTGFLDYVWRLLIRDPDIRLGADHQQDGQTLVQAEGATTYAPTHISIEGPDANVQSSTVVEPKRSELSSEGVVHAPDVRIESRPAERIPGIFDPINIDGLRLFASESRIWRTIAGHEADFARIPGLDFVCLSIIAASGRSGIPQNDLVRISGQDKRSLPLRTDRLHQNGYIIKRPVNIHVDKRLLHTSLLILKRYSETSEAIATEITEAANSNQKTSNSKKKRAIAKSSAVDHNQSLDLHDEGDGATQSTPMPDPTAWWVPDRSLWNQIFDIVRLSGTAGITLNRLSRDLMGPHYKKPLEEILAKLTQTWQLSQPMHLRHLAIVRDSVQSGRTSVYVYYTFEYYQTLVDAGQKTWEAVLMLQGVDSRRKTVGKLDSDPELDEHGFANLEPGQFQGQHNDASLIECVSASRIYSKRAGAGTIRASEIEKPFETFSRRSPNVPKSTNMFPSTPRRNETTVVGKNRGRPRKYALKGIPADIESWKPDEIKSLVESRRMHDSYQKAKITDEIERRTQRGEDSVLVTHEVLEINDALRKEQGQDPLSQFMIMQIISEYAGGTQPVQEDDTMVHLRKLLKNSEQKSSSKRGRPRKATSAAHSFADDGSTPPSALVGDSSPISLGPIGTRNRRPPKAFGASPSSHNAVDQDSQSSVPHWHLPSVAAHTQYPHSISAATAAVVQTTMPYTDIQKRGRSQTTIDASADLIVAQPRPKRQKRNHDPGHVVSPASAARVLRSPSSTRGVLYISTMGDQFVPLADCHLMLETYETVVNSMSRPYEGVFISRSAQRYRRRNEPQSIASRRYQVAIFRLRALNGLVWFKREQNLMLSAVSDPSQRPEQKSNRQMPADDAREIPILVVQSSTNVHLSIENPNAVQHYRRANDVRHESHSQVGGDSSAAMLVPDLSLSTLGARRQDSSATSTVTSEHEGVISVGTQASRIHTPDARTASATSICNAPPSPNRPAHTDHQALLHALAPKSASELVNKMPVTPVGENVGMETFVTDASLRDMDPDSGRKIYVLEDMNDAATRTRRTSPTRCSLNIVFKLQGLKGLDWFQNVSSQSEVLSRPLSHVQVESESTLESIPTDHAEELRTGLPDDAREEAPTQEDQHSPVKQRGRGSRRGKPVGITGRTGGSTAILRRDIVMHLVEICGGVFSEAGAMRIPFQQEWKQRGQAGVPEKRTIMNAVNMCCEQGKLRRIVFSFEDNNGISATSTVFAMPDIDPGDARVRELQDVVKQSHPHLFIPAVVAPVDTVAEYAKMNRQQKLLEAAERQAKIQEAKAMALKTPEERESYLAALQSSDLSEREIEALSRLAEPSTHRVQRPGTITKPANPKSSLPTAAEAQTERVTLGGHLSSIASDHSFGERPLMSGNFSAQGSHRPRRLPIEERDGPSVRFERSHQRLQGPARNNALVERDQRQISRAYLHAQDSDVHWLTNARKEYINPGFIDPIIGHLEGTGAIQTPDMGFPTGWITSEYSARARNKKRPNNEAQIFPGFMDPVIMYHRATGTFSATFPGFRSGRTRLNLRGKRRFTPRLQVPVGYKSPFTNLQLDNGPLFPGISSRDILHSSTGTFAVKFFGFRPGHVNAAQVQNRRGGRPMRTTADIGTLKISGKSKRKRLRKESGAGGRLSEEDGPPIDPMFGSPFKLRRLRGPQSTKALGKTGALRLSVAVMVVRLLTGGIRMTIDWSLVTKAFTPEHDEKFIRSKWSSVLSQMRHNQIKMDADFQKRFIKAYKEGLIPTIDFEHLDEYDWKWLVDWAMTQLDAPMNAAPELLVPRASFDQRYVVKNTSQRKDLAHFFEFEGFSTRELRRSVVNRQAIVCDAFAKRSPHHASIIQSEDEQVAIARSWIRASIVTSVETSDSHVIRSKLSSFSAVTIDAALKSLLEDKVITERPKYRTKSDFDYDISDYFEKRLRTNISPAQFHSAFAFKLRLDRAIQSQGRVRWDYLAQDGDVMALLNLMANLKVKVVPVNPPLNKWGHTDDGYASRQMDKSKLNFEMDIVPSSTYIMGNPLDPLPTPPAPHLRAVDHGVPKIPTWFDVNEALIPKLWTPVLAAVLGLLAVRSGATAEELQVHLRPSLETWEVEEVLQWMVHAEVAETVGSHGFKTREWWWMALGPSPGPESANDGHRLGFASTADRSNALKRRNQQAEERNRKRVASGT